MIVIGDGDYQFGRSISIINILTRANSLNVCNDYKIIVNETLTV